MAERARTLTFLFVVALAAACEGAPTKPEPSEPLPSPTCARGVARGAIEAADRKIVGEAADYPADGTLRGREEALASSQRDRRAAAWNIAAKVLAAVPLADAPPGGSYVPRFVTWYDADDVRRVFRRLYDPLTHDEKAARTRFTSEAIDAAFAWNVTAVEELPNWPIERYLEHVASLDTPEEVNGVGGISRVVYSPATVRHFVASYPEILACREHAVPAPLESGPIETVRVLDERLDLATCERREVGKHHIGIGETLIVTLASAEDAHTRIAVTDDAGALLCDASDECVVEGPRTVAIGVVAEAGGPATVKIDRENARPAWAACLDGAFPLDAVVVKADYRRADFDLQLPTFDTSADALRARLAGDASWTVADGEADPGPTDIFTLTLPSGARFRLAALHIMTKELDHWTWTTLFWSSSPDTDFGADRPAAITGEFAHYKLCSVTSFDERDEAPNGGLTAPYPSLAASLGATYHGVGAPTWCSNPYLEAGHGNAATNCIGCHQHAGTGQITEDILLYPAFGTTQARNNFPTDYSFAVTSGDNLSQLFADTELYYLGPP
ncbi:MAG: hypothetical protein U0271_14900 [Polyangiaceae bacterium]